jgi:hypothetical protein
MTSLNYDGFRETANAELIAKAKLPPANTRRWVPRRKAEVVSAVHSGLLSLHEACEIYTLTVEEFLSWQNAMERHGLAGLRVTQAQNYRLARSEKRRAPRMPVDRNVERFSRQAANA